jgi:hypothetical protein
VSDRSQTPGWYNIYRCDYCGMKTESLYHLNHCPHGNPRVRHYPSLRRMRMSGDAAETTPTVHCWESGPEDPEDGCATTCMLLEGHEGPHEWTRDSNIIVSFG